MRAIETRLFKRLTVGFDWELWVVDRGGLPVGKRELAAIATELNRREPALPIGLDLDQVELRSGIAATYAEIAGRAARARAALDRVAAARRRAAYPFAGHPLVRNFSGGHVHVGTVDGLELGLAAETKNALAPYVPALVALGASSPFTELRAGAFKSYRAAFRAYGCALPVLVAAPGATYVRGLEDVALKVDQRPTIEVRIADSPCSARLLAELAALAAGLVAGVAAAVERGDLARPDERGVEEGLANRYNASRHGLQATFRLGRGPRIEASSGAASRGGRARGGNGRPPGTEVREVGADELVAEALELARPGLRALGTDVEALGLVRRMVERRATQADFQRWAAAGEPDPYALPRRLLEAAGRGGEGFERWLEREAPVLPRLAFEPLEEAVLARAGRSRPVPWTKVNFDLGLPPALLARIAGKLAADGQVEIVEDPERGMALRRSVPCSESLPRSSPSGRRTAGVAARAAAFVASP